MKTNALKKLTDLVNILNMLIYRKRIFDSFRFDSFQSPAPKPNDDDGDNDDDKWGMFILTGKLR